LPEAGAQIHDIDRERFGPLLELGFGHAVSMDGNSDAVRSTRRLARHSSIDQSIPVNNHQSSTISNPLNRKIYN
jgi:hypothetical protein